MADRSTPRRMSHRMPRRARRHIPRATLARDLVYDLPDLAATAALARRLAERALPGDVIALSGELGAGKTTFARAFIHALADLRGGAREEVPSPTFTLVQVYDLPGLSVWHIDLYRLDRPEDAIELGIEEAFSGAVSLIEWPEKLGRLLPEARLDLRLDILDAPGARRATLVAAGPAAGVAGAAGAWAERLGGIAGHV